MGLVLIVEDDADARFFAMAHAERFGHDVNTANDGLEAWTLYQQRVQNPSLPQYDLVVTDLMMPRMSGEQLAQRIRDVRPEQPIVMITGNHKKVDCQIPVFYKPVPLREYDRIFSGDIYAR